MSHFYRLVVSCPDQVGIVAEVSSFIAAQGGSITEASQHSDLQTGRFYALRNISGFIGYVGGSVTFGL